MATDTPRQMTGVFKLPNGSAYPNETVTFFRDPRGTYGQGGSVVADEIVKTVLNSSGEINVSLMAGVYLAMIRLSDADRYFNVHVPDLPGPHNIGDYIGENPRPGIVTAILQALAEIMDAYGELGPFVGFRDSVIAGFRSAGILQLENVAGTGDAITADLPDNIAATSFTGDKWFAFIAAADSTAPAPKITVGGHERTLRDMDGAVLPAGFIKAGRVYIFRTVSFAQANLIIDPISQAELQAMLNEVNNGRVFFISGTLDPSGADVPLGADLIIVNHNASETFTVWRSRGAPQDGLETDAIKKDANDRWWQRSMDQDLPAIVQSILALGEEIDTERLDRTSALSRIGGMAAPGDGTILVDDLEKKPLLGVNPDGSTFAWMKLMMPKAPGDFIAKLVDDESGKTLFGFDIRDGTIFPKLTAESLSLILDIPTAPGDWIVPVIEDETGRILFGVDIRDGSVYPATSSNGGDGSTVEFVDPHNQGDAWNSIKTTDEHGDVIRYLSRQWRETWGYEKRGDITLAQTPDPAVCMVAFGGGNAGIARPIVEDFRWHLVNEELARPEDGMAATAHGVAFLDGEFESRKGLLTVIALTHPISSTVEADALPGSPGREALKTRVAAARDAIAGWGKALVLDRICLSLLEGAPQTPQATADLHYAAVANGMRLELSEAAGQASAPVVVVSQSFGSRDDGTSEVILAEGNLDWAHWSLRIVVATPRYPFPLQPGSPAALTPEGALLVSELENLAAMERLGNRNWYGPTMEANATLSGSTITVPFTAMSDLVIRDPSNHGFEVDGVTNGATIASVSVSGVSAILTMSAAPEGDLTVRYAFGQTGDPGDGYAANRGSLTDSWTQESRLVPGETLYRYARSGRAPVMR